MLTLFDDQEELMASLRAAMKRSKAILLQSPTGSGKTAMATDMVMRAVGKNNKMLFSVPRKALLQQTSDTFSKYGIEHGYVAAGRPFNPYSQVYVGMVDTMARRLEILPKVKLIVIDETRFGDKALGKVINHYKKQGAWVIGLDATPWKLNGQGLGVWYDEMIQGKSIRWLIDNKRLSDYRFFYGKPHADFDALTKKSDKQIAGFMEEKRVIIGDAVNDYRKRGMGRIWIVRCTSIRHSQITADTFNNSGIPARHIDGNTPDDEQRAIFKAWARREILVVTFSDLLNFGFDLAQASGVDVCIEGGSDLKPSNSLSGQLQFWGRMLRMKPDPAIIHDHVNNYIKHGLPCADRIWTLDSKKKRDKGETVPPTRQCPECFYVHSPTPSCPECGHVYVIEGRKIKQVDGELQEMDINAQKKDHLADYLPPLNDERTLTHLIKQARNKGYKNPVSWAAKELAKRMGSM